MFLKKPTKKHGGADFKGRGSNTGGINGERGIMEQERLSGMENGREAQKDYEEG